MRHRRQISEQRHNPCLCRKKTPPRQNRRAYTLVEMLLVVIVASLLATVAVTSVSSRHQYIMPAAAKRLAADLRMARTLAIEYNTTYEVRFNLASQNYEIVHTGTANVPPLRDPLAPPGSSQTRYLVAFSRYLQGASSSGGAGVRLDSVRIPSENRDVTNIPFGATGSTGPGRTADTLITLAHGQGSNTQRLTLTLSWLTGQVWID